jgi:hypothetical protein
MRVREERERREKRKRRRKGYDDDPRTTTGVGPFLALRLIRQVFS